MPSRLAAGVACVALATSTAGCKPCGPPAECVLGTGVLAFIGVEDGDALRISPGGQGGYHLWAALLARGLDPRQAMLDLDLDDASSGERVNRYSARTTLQPFDPSLVARARPVDLAGWDPDMGFPPLPDPGADLYVPADGGREPYAPRGAENEWFVTLAQTARFPETFDLARVTGARLRMTATLTDVNGCACTDQRVVTAYR